MGIGIYTSPSHRERDLGRGDIRDDVSEIGGGNIDLTRPHPNPPPWGEGIKINDLQIV